MALSKQHPSALSAPALTLLLPISCGRGRSQIFVIPKMMDCAIRESVGKLATCQSLIPSVNKRVPVSHKFLLVSSCAISAMQHRRILSSAIAKLPYKLVYKTRPYKSISCLRMKLDWFYTEIRVLKADMRLKIVYLVVMTA